MINFHTNLKIIDNSGAKKVQCIKVLRGSQNRYASIGDEITVTVKKSAKHLQQKKNKVAKGEVHRALVVGTRKKSIRRDGSTITFANNLAIIINKEKNPLSTRIFTSIPYEVDYKKYPKVYSIAPSVI